MSPTEIKNALTEGELRKIYDNLGDPDISREEMVASIMFVNQMEETKASEFLDWNFSQLAQMDFDLELRDKLKTQNPNFVDL